MWVGLWHGGHSYGPPDPLDAETFGSIREAAGAMRDRESMGHHWPQTFRYVFREADSALTPCAHSEGSGHMALYRVSAAWLTTEEGRDKLRRHLETDGYPDRMLTFGPRGGVRSESC